MTKAIKGTWNLKLSQRNCEMKILNGLYILIIIVFGGCAEIHISSLTDKNYTIDTNSKIFLYQPEEETIEVKNLYFTLYDLMNRMGFKISSFEESNYILLAALDVKEEPFTFVIPKTTKSYTSGYVGSTLYSGTTTGKTYVPVTMKRIVKKIYMSLYDLDKFRESGKKVLVWEGYIGSVNEECKHIEDCLYTLLQRFGTDFKGRVYLQRDKTRVKQ
jgi:hypothetical protein